ncbi:MAG TPA: hypothetical protein VK927_06595 [Adhaeribacter sp.]|nr:hypothetical protein [Adhaeribacter sp.]
MNTFTPDNFKILLLENSIGIYFDTQDHWLYVDWTGRQDLNTIKHGCEQLMYFIDKQACTKLLNDNTKITNDWSEAEDWLCTDLPPRLSKSGIKYIAWVYPANYSSRLSTDKVIRQLGTFTITIGFDNLQTASTWLHSV